MSDLCLTIFSRPGESAGQSPFVIAFQRAGVKGLKVSVSAINRMLMHSAVLPSIVNAVLIVSAFSAANTFIFTASRVLYGLAVQNKAPKIFATCSKDGLPWIAVLAAVRIISASFACLPDGLF